jgi:hypothetical protein
MRYIIVLLLLMSGMSGSNAGTLMERLRLAQSQTVAECVSNCSFEQLFLRSELRAIRSMRFAMYSRVSGVQNRMRQTQIAVVFPRLFVPADVSANTDS